jgi:uncharacterized protein (TIGR04255 family)
MTEAALAIFGGIGPGDVPLTRPPLARALAQIRFPVFSAFKADDQRVAQELAVSLAKDYPLFQEGHEVNIVITPDGVTQSPGTAPLWKLSDATNTWQISFSHGFLSIDTSAYPSRHEFVLRLVSAWTAFIKVARPPFVERVGVRYVNRITEAKHLSQLADLVRPEILGVVGAPAGEARMVRGLSEALYELSDGPALQARWGYLPADASIDPTMSPVGVPSWMLDLDAFQAWPAGNLRDPEIGEIASDLALRAYEFFRWAVTREFLVQFGGQPE